MYQRNILSLLFLMFTTSIFAQKGIELQYSAKKIEVGEQLVVVYNVSNLNEKNIILPKYDPFILIGGPSVSRSMNTSIYNGHMTQSSTNSYTIYLTCKKIGKFKVPKCEFLMSDGSKIPTSEVEIEVVKQGTLPKQAPPQQNPYDPFAGMYDPFDPFSNFPGQGRAPQRQAPQASNPSQPQVYTDPSKINLKNDIFAKIILNKNKVYVGEQIYATVKIYTSVNSNGFEAEKVPNFNGFWSQDIKLPEKLELKREMINGREFVSVEIKKMILFPTKAGTLEISPLKMKTVALVPVQTKPTRSQPRDLFDMLQMMMQGNMGGVEYKQIPYSFSSGSEKVVVLPLPEGAPSSFTGAVGSYTMNSYSNKKALKTDEALSYTIEITGNGNLPLIENPKIEWNEDLEVYEPKLTENYNHIPTFNGTKRWEYTAIPHNPGSYATPKYEFTYFDLKSAKYVTLNSESTPLTITGNPTKNKGQGKSFENSLARKKISKNSTELHSARMGDSMFWGLFLTPLLLACGLILVPKFDSGTSGKFASDKKIREKVNKQLKVAKSYLDQNKKTEFYNEVHRAIFGYLGNKLKMEPSLLSRDNISDKLESRQASPTTISSLISLIDNCEMSLYSNINTEQMKENYEESLNVLSHLEKEIV